MNISRLSLVALLTAMGSESAANLNIARLQKKVKNLPKALADGILKKPKDDANGKLLETLLEAVEEGFDIEISGDEGGEEAAVEAPAEPKDTKKQQEKAAKDKKKADKEPTTEGAPAEPTKKDKKPKPSKKAGGKEGPGVIASMVEWLTSATEDTPVTKKTIMARLAKRFPDRDIDGMLKTVNIQVPSRLKNEKGLKIMSKEMKEGGKGYWIKAGKS